MPVVILCFISIFIGCGSSLVDFNNSGLGKWRSEHHGVIIDKDPENNIYQIQVLRQKHNECSAHENRNLLFASSMFSNGCRSFAFEYARMLDEYLLEEMLLNTVCDIEYSEKGLYKTKKPERNERGIRRNPDLKKFMEENPENYMRFLPKNSLEDINNIVNFRKYINDMYFQNQLKLIRQESTAIENGLSDDACFDSACLIRNGFCSPNSNSNIEKLYGLANKKYKEGEELNIPIVLSLHSTGNILHATSLLVRSDGNSYEYIFMDPLNWRFSGNESYKKVIGSIKRLLEDPDHFKRSIIRSGYFESKSYESISVTQRRSYAFPIFAYAEVLENTGLMESDFFVSFYKEPICNLVDRLLGGDPVEVELMLDDTGNRTRLVPDARVELRERFGCNLKL